MQKLICLVSSHLSFVFVSIALGDYPKKTLVWFVRECFACVLFWSFRVSCLIFKSLSHLEFILAHGVRVCSNFTDLRATVELSPHYLLKRVTFSHWIFLPKERENILTSTIHRWTWRHYAKWNKPFIKKSSMSLLIWGTYSSQIHWTKSRMVAGGGGNGELLFNGCGFPFEKTTNFWRRTVVMVIQYCECA